MQDRLGFGAARSYARKAIKEAVRVLGPQTILDIGSGTVANGPFSDDTFRAEVAVQTSKWFCLDVAQQHFQVTLMRCKYSYG